MGGISCVLAPPSGRGLGASLVVADGAIRLRRGGLLERLPLLVASGAERCHAGEGGATQVPAGGDQVAVALGVREGVAGAPGAGAPDAGAPRGGGQDGFGQPHFEPHLVVDCGP